MPRKEWTRRLGALLPKRITASWSGSPDPTEYKFVAQSTAHGDRLPPDRSSCTSPIADCLSPRAERRRKYAVGLEECSQSGSNKRMGEERNEKSNRTLTEKAPYKPDAVAPHVRFDERGEETELWRRMRHRQLAKAVGNSYSLSPKRHRVSSRLYHHGHHEFENKLRSACTCR